MIRSLKRGFTIVEVMVVIAVLSILITIVSSAASSAIKQSRGKRAEAMRQTLQAGLATYYAQTGDWPKGIKTFADSGDGSRHDVILLGASDATDALQTLVEESLQNKANPYLDVSGLFVIDKSKWSSGYKGGASGIDFKIAVTPKAKGGRGWNVSQMMFGYQDTESAKFRRFYIGYHVKTDTVTVYTQGEAYSAFNKTYPGNLDRIDEVAN